METAIGMVMLMLCLLGILEGGRAMYIDHFLSHAASAAARYAMVRGSTWHGVSCTSTAYGCTATSDDVTAFVTSMGITGVASDNLTVSTSWPGKSATGGACDTAFGNNGPGCAVSVQVVYAFDWAIPFLPATALSLNGTSVETVVQ